jgi:hypothetical protein
MKGNLQDEQTIHPSAEKIAAKPQKAAYSSPALQVYGSVGKLTQGSGGSGGDARGQQVSDPRAKENMVRVGTHPLGIGLYLFDYLPEHQEKWGRGRQFGVMADEVEAVMPEAVSMHPDGYRQVDYGMLGISRILH